MALLVVVENPKNWSLDLPVVEVVAARDYLTQPRYSERRRDKVFNMCRRYGYQTVGYYVSLLAEARGHRPIPSVATLQDLRLAPVVRAVSDDLDDLIQKSLAGSEPRERTIRIYFGGSADPAHERLARALFSHFPSPLLLASFSQQGRWRLDNVRPIATSEIPDEERATVVELARLHFQRRRETSAPGGAARYDLAILYDPQEVDAPSGPRAIQKFLRAARSLGLDATVIGKEDFADLAEYDALFIRETTMVDHHTYRFARKAEAEGLVVIDAPSATLRCSNKVYLAELFARHQIPAPRTVIVHRDTDPAQLAAEIRFPIVLKRPDSSFSQGVHKANDEGELRGLLSEFFKNSELAVAQEFLPTEFDWRIGVLNGACLFACQYHMAPGHWQIQKSGAGGYRRYGKVEVPEPAEVPAGAVEVGVRAASLIGDGLFGVDVKEVDGRFLVVEVNDNPNIDVGNEDRLLGDELYLKVMRWFLERLERRGISGEKTA